MLLESIWFFLWGLLWAVYFMTDGFDLGLGTLMPFLGKTRRQTVGLGLSEATKQINNEL